MSTTRNRKKDTVLAVTFGEHVKELRTRLMWVGLVFLVLSSIAYYFREPLIDIVRKPLGDQQLVYLTPAGGFSFIFSVTMYAAMVVTAPFLVYQIYRFVKPALPKRARKYSIQVFSAAVVLMLTGVMFGYFFAVPAALKFLTTFAGDVVAPNLTAESYLNFFMAYIAGLGILFQLPLLLIFWNWISPLKPGQLLKSQRFVIAGAFVAAALITPTPDAFNQCMVAAPIILVYQLGAITVFTTNKRARRRARRAEAIVKSVTSQPTPQQHVTQPAARAVKKPAPVPVATVQPVQHKPSVQMHRPARSMDMVRPQIHHQAQRSTPSRHISPPQRPTGPQMRRSLDGISRTSQA